MEIAKKIKTARIKVELTQEHVADELQVSRQTISNWENAKTYPDIISIIKLSDLYQISLDELLKGDDNIILFFGLVIFNTIISNNKYLLASVLVIAMCSIAALFYQVIKKF